MSLRKIECIVFDFDGTLAKLTIDFDDMRNQVADLAQKHLGYRPEHNGRPVLEWIEELSITLRKGPGLDGFGDQARELVTHIEKEAAKKGRIFSFTNALFRNLSGMGVKTAVITRNCRDAVAAAHPTLHTLTGAVLTRDDVVRVKPDPAHIQAALRLVEADAERTLMVGDHPMDIATGKRAGTMTAGVLSGSGDMGAMLSSGADMVVRNAGVLIKILQFEGRLGA